MMEQDKNIAWRLSLLLVADLDIRLGAFHWISSLYHAAQVDA